MDVLNDDSELGSVDQFWLQLELSNKCGYQAKNMKKAAKAK